MPRATASRPSGTRAEQTAARRRSLIRAATELAAEGGYEAVQMRDVAARAGVALGTLYRHFSSKDALLVAALADQATALREQLAQRPPRGSSPAERVSDVLRRAARALERDPALTAAMVTAMSSPETESAAIKRDVLETLTAVISGAIDGDPVTELDHVDLDEIMRVLGHVWFSALVFWVAGMAPTGQMADDLSQAARLLLR